MNKTPYSVLFKVVLFTALALVPFKYCLAQEISEKQQAIIYNEAIKTLKSYEQYNNEIADNVVDLETTNKVSQKLIDLFVSRKAIIYNDLDPSHKLSEAYELETYIANMLLWYPDGMKFFIDYDNLKAGNIISHGNDIYTVDIMTTKRLNGNYLNKQNNTQTEEVLFRIAFFQKNKTFENYRIAGVRSSKAKTLADDSKLLAEVKSVTFSDKEMQLIKDQTKMLFSDYLNFLNLISDPKETEEDKAYYSISFKGLFKDSTLKVVNDIEPDPQQRWISIAEYQKNLTQSYPEGIRNIGMNLDSAEYGKVIPEGNDKFYINGYIEKFFSGKYMSKTVFRDNSKYDFKVSFEKDENTFKNFKLASVDKFGVNLYSQTSNTTQELPKKSIASIRREGLYFGVFMGGGLTSYNNDNLSINPLLGWSNQGKSAINFEILATWYLAKRVGVNMGLSFNKYSANANLSGSFTNTNYTNDFNGEPHIKSISSNFDSLLVYQYISIPTTLIVHSNANPEKWGFYFEGGIVTSFKTKSSYKTSGNYSTSGYYEQYPSTVQILSDPELGFVNRTNINGGGNLKTSPVHLAIKAAIGITYPLNYFTSLYFAPELTYGLSNVSDDKTITDDFGNITTAKKVGISKYGVKFGISYKF